ncbi:hypothetical protein ACLOJK_003783 [Asimina triloba]
MSDRAYVLPRLSSIARESDDTVEANEDADDGACGGEHLWRICRVEAEAETTCGGDNGRKIEGFSRSSEVDEAADYGAETICRGVVDICGGCVWMIRATTMVLRWTAYGGRVDLGPARAESLTFLLHDVRLAIGDEVCFHTREEETLMEKHANRSGEIKGIELSSRGKGSTSHSKFAGGSSQSIPIEPANEVNKNKKGMVLPFASLSLTFDNVTYSVDVPQMFIEEVMDLVELNSLRDALVGLPGVSGLSSEQRKRLTISVELITDVPLNFLMVFVLKLGVPGVAIAAKLGELKQLAVVSSLPA